MQSSLPSLFTSGVVGALVLAVTQPAWAELRYDPEPGDSLAYSVEIVAELPDSTETLKGVIVYTVKQKTDDQIKLEYRGGLNKSARPKAVARGRRRGPARRPGGRPAGGPRSLFATPTFKGLTQTTNQLTLTPRGEVLAMVGDSQLPYLLGNLSTLIFESFPETEQPAWEVKNGVAISEKNERQTFPRFGPRRAGGNSSSENEKRSAGVETTSYKITGTQGDLVTVEKTYALESPIIDGKGFGFEGKGTWAFDQAKSVPQKLDFRQDLTVRLNNVAVKLPITTQYELLTEEQLAEHRQAEEKRQQDRKAQLAKAQEQIKARQNAPLTPEQKAEVLKNLASDDMRNLRSGLNTLRFKNPQEPDAEIAAALKKLADHNNPGIRRQAEQIGRKWSAPQNEK